MTLPVTFEDLELMNLEDVIKQEAEEIHENPEKVKDIAKNLYDEAKEGLEKIAKLLDDMYKTIFGETVGSIISGIGQKLANILFYLVIYYGVARGKIEALAESGKHIAFEDLRPTLLDLNTLLESYTRKLITDNDFVSELRKHGFSEERIKILRSLTLNTLTVSEISELYRRGFITTDEAINRLQKLGYTTEDSKKIVNSFNSLLPVDVAIKSWQKGGLSESELNEILRKYGYSDKDIEHIKYVATKELGVSDLFKCYWRGLISERDLDTLLSWQGYEPETIRLIKELTKYIPPISDLITMSVREAFNDTVAKKYGYDEEFPDEFAYYSEMQGMSKDWAKRYWRAHWQLPSPTMGYEMFRRGIISKQELDDLLKIADYPKYWRERLIQLAYDLPTRVDVRRMYDLGVITDNEVYEFHRKLGYDERTARALTEYVIADTMSSERNSIISEIKKQYLNGALNETEVREMLRQLKVNQYTIDLYLQAWNLTLEREQLEFEIDVIHYDYISGIITETDAVSKLSSLGLRANQISRYMYNWKREKEKNKKRLTPTQICDAVKFGIIKKEEAIDKLVNYGYNRTDAEILIALRLKGVSVE